MWIPSIVKSHKITNFVQNSYRTNFPWWFHLKIALKINQQKGENDGQFFTSKAKINFHGARILIAKVVYYILVGDTLLIEVVYIKFYGRFYIYLMTIFRDLPKMVEFNLVVVLSGSKEMANRMKFLARVNTAYCSPLQN